MISWLFNDLFVLGGELRHGAIRDPAKVTQEFSGGAGGGIQHCSGFSLEGLGEAENKDELLHLVWGLWDDQLSRTEGGSPRGFWINPGCGSVQMQQ